MLVFVRLSSERVRQAVRQDRPFAKKRESPHWLLVVQGERGGSAARALASA